VYLAIQQGLKAVCANAFLRVVWFSRISTWCPVGKVLSCPKTENGRARPVHAMASRGVSLKAVGESRVGHQQQRALVSSNSLWTR